MVGHRGSARPPARPALCGNGGWAGPDRYQIDRGPRRSGSKRVRPATKLSPQTNPSKKRLGAAEGRAGPAGDPDSRRLLSCQILARPGLSTGPSARPAARHGDRQLPQSFRGRRPSRRGLPSANPQHKLVPFCGTGPPPPSVQPPVPGPPPCQPCARRGPRLRRRRSQSSLPTASRLRHRQRSVKKRYANKPQRRHQLDVRLPVWWISACYTFFFFTAIERSAPSSSASSSSGARRCCSPQLSGARARPGSGSVAPNSPRTPLSWSRSFLQGLPLHHSHSSPLFVL